MDAIDEIGKFHDYEMDQGIDKTRSRRRFVRNLKRAPEVPTCLVYVLWLGLLVYDLSPKWLKKLFKKTVK